MKFGMRKPSLSRSLSARTTGRAKRTVKRAIIPGYGRRGIGWLNPKKALYNRVYRRNTFSIFNLAKGSSRGKGCLVAIIIYLTVAATAAALAMQMLRRFLHGPGHDEQQHDDYNQIRHILSYFSALQA